MNPASDNGTNTEFYLVTLSISGLAGAGLQNGVCLSGCRKSVLKGDLEEHLPSPLMRLALCVGVGQVPGWNFVTVSQCHRVPWRLEYPPSPHLTVLIGTICVLS